MKAIKNIQGEKLAMPWSGQTYYFPKDATVLVEEELAEFLKERWPLAFDWDPPKEYKGKGKKRKEVPIPKVSTKKTPSFLGPMAQQPVDMKITQAGGQTSTFEGGTLEIE